MTSERIAEIKALCEAATPGPWSCSESRWDCFFDCDKEMETCGQEPSSCGNGYCLESAWVDNILTVRCGDFDGMNDADANFIAAARQIIPELLEELEKKERLLTNAAVQFTNIQLAYEDEIDKMKGKFNHESNS